MDELTDDELLTFMKEQFDTVCFGDTDYLGDTCLEIFSQAAQAIGVIWKVADAENLKSWILSNDGIRSCFCKR